MTAGQIGMVALGDSDLVLANEEDDVRGISVLDPNGHRVGEVGEIVVDEEERRARILVVTSCAILGFGRGQAPRARRSRRARRARTSTSTRPTMPCVTERGVRPGPDGSPDYAEVYARYGYAPFWHVGYTAPYFLDRQGRPCAAELDASRI